MFRKPVLAGVFVAGLFTLPACSTDPGVSAKVAGAVRSLTLAETSYVKTCKDVPALVICVEPAKQRIKDLDNRAYAAVKMAEDNEAMVTYAISAIGDFIVAVQAR